jgi:hypothetical protein
MNLRRNNTLEVTAALDIAVTAKTWVGTGIYFGALGCLRFSLCSAQDVVYSAHVDIKVEIQGKSVRKALISYASIFKHFILPFYHCGLEELKTYKNNSCKLN